MASIRIGLTTLIACACAAAQQLPLTHFEGTGEFAAALVASGDLDGDGVADLVVGAPRGLRVITRPGLVRAFSGADGRVLFTKFGVEDGALFGSAVGDAGDVDGDGHDEVLIGVSGADANGLDAGMVVVVSGASHGELFRIGGSTSGERFGAAVAGLGDVDADGHDDFAVGAPGSASSTGVVRVFSGADGRVLHTILGVVPGGAFGASLAAAGDVDGDGFPDLVAGAPAAGRAVVISGFDGSSIHALASTDLGVRFGESVAGVGDFDGDLCDDFAVGAPGHFFDAGQVTVYSGALGTLLHTWRSKIVGERWGAVCAAAGDVDGDGRDDVLVTAPGAAVPAARVMSGATGTSLAEFNSPRPGDGFGSAAAGRADLDGDGLAEIVVGAPTDAAGGGVIGRAYVFDAGFVARASIETLHGVACAGGGGRIPRIGHRGRARIGRRLDVTLRGAPPNSATVSLLPGDPLGYPGGIALDVIGLTGCSLYTSPWLTLAPGTDAFGRASVSVPVDNDPGFIGFAFTFQWVSVDPSAPRVIPLSLSDALTVRIGGI